MKKIFIIPYYGDFPNYFELFLKTCEKNIYFDWLIFTDIEVKVALPNNVTVIKISFAELRNFIQKKFDFQIALNTPYKLCDYKPAYGYIFSEYLENYDYWGYCDLDVLFGDLSKILPDETILQYDKIGHLGHLSLFRNIPDINTAFMEKVNEDISYKKIFTTNNICIFDEWGEGSINYIFMKLGKKVLFFDKFMDIFPYDSNMKQVTASFTEKGEFSGYIIDKHLGLVIWEDGILYQLVYTNGCWKKVEQAYAHFQKRKMKMLCSVNDNRILGIPDEFITLKNEKVITTYMPYFFMRRIFNVKKILWKLKCFYYASIEKTAWIRHKLRKIRKYMGENYDS